jgi:hypothetical protein
VVITRRGQPVARMVREHPQSAGPPDWVSWLRALHGDHQGTKGSAVALLRVLGDGGWGAVSQARPACCVNTCLLVWLFHTDSGYPAAESWLTRVDHCIRQCILRL